MRPIVSEEMVEQALFRLESKGVKPTLDAIRAELGNHGSKTTIVKHVRALKARNRDSQYTQCDMTDRFYYSDDFLNASSSSGSRSNDFARFIEIFKKSDAFTDNPKLTEEFATFCAELKDENRKYKKLLSTALSFQQQLIELMNKSAGS